MAVEVAPRRVEALLRVVAMAGRLRVPRRVFVPNLPSEASVWTCVEAAEWVGGKVDKVVPHARARGFASDEEAVRWLHRARRVSDEVFVVSGDDARARGPFETSSEMWTKGSGALRLSLIHI